MKKLMILLFSRLFLFLLFQMIIAVFLNSWGSAVKYWTLVASLANVVSIILIYILLRQENISFFSIFKIRKENWKMDLFWFLIFAIISVPVAIVPSLAISKLLWANTEYYHQILFQPMPRQFAIALLFVYPVSAGLIELTTYFGYLMPRLKNHIKSDGLVIAITGIAFSIQNCTLPLVLESKFILFRGVMYLIFSLLFAFMLNRRPSLLPWLSILLTIIYILPMMMLIGISR